MEFIIFGVILLMIVGFVVSCYNGFIKMKLKCEEAFSTMDVYLKKRFDLIPNLVETVKGYAKHEKETLQDVVDARASIGNASNNADKFKAEDALSNALSKLMMIHEAYPDLKANAQFLDLQAQLKEVEDGILSSRKYYNAIVTTYNTAILVFPKNIIAMIFKFDKFDLYEIVEEQRENVEIKF